VNTAIRKNNTGIHDALNLLMGLVIGWVAGFGAMLLLAPQSGKKTRVQIEQKSIELQDRAADTFNDLLALSHFDDREILTETRR
jgi:gas vesicle protein